MLHLGEKKVTISDPAKPTSVILITMAYNSIRFPVTETILGKSVNLFKVSYL